MTTSKALPPPGARASDIWILILSPGFMSSVWPFGVKVAVFASCGAGGPVGTPSCWMKPKLTGSSQLALQVAKPVVHSRLSMVSAAHQCVSSQLALSTNGGFPGGSSCISTNAEPPPLWAVVHATPKQVGAFEFESGEHWVCGYEFGSHMAIGNHGAGESWNQCETSWPGLASVGSAAGSRPRDTVQFTLLPEPGALDKKVVSGSS